MGTDPIANGVIYTAKTNTKGTNHKAEITSASNESVFSQKKVTDTETKKKAQIVANIKYDLGNEILSKNDTRIMGKVVKQDKYLYFDHNKFTEITGKDLTFGDIAKRYGLKEGELKKANDLRFGASSDMAMKPGKGDNLNCYTPADANLNFVKIPRESIEDHLNGK